MPTRLISSQLGIYFFKKIDLMGRTGGAWTILRHDQMEPTVAESRRFI